MSIWRIIRVPLIVTAFFLIYLLVPLGGRNEETIGLRLAVNMVLITMLAIWQVIGVLKSQHPIARAVEGLALTVPFFVLSFSACYYMLELSEPGTFNQALTRLDALYFTVTVFSTTGFGDITAISQTGRGLVTAQMIIDLIVIGIGLKVFLSAVQRSKERLLSESKGN